MKTGELNDLSIRDVPSECWLGASRQSRDTTASDCAAPATSATLMIARPALVAGIEFLTGIISAKE